MKKPDKATMRVMTPWMINNHCQPAIPACNIVSVRPCGQPLRETYHAVHFEDAQSNQSCESSSKNIASIENRDPRSQLFPRVECCQDVQCSWVVRSLGDTQEESCEQQAYVVSTDSSQATDDSPHSHTRGHPDAGLHPRDDHVRRDANDNVPGKQDSDTGLILRRSQAKVFFKRVQSGESNCVAVL